MRLRGAGARRALGTTTLVAGLCALGTGIAGLHSPATPPADAGTVVTPTPASATPSPTVTPRRATAAAPATPAEVRIPTLKVTAPVDPAGVESDGELRIPADPVRLGWWIGSARPGEPRGTVLIAGHVDTAEAGRGALFRLETLAVGARIEVRADGRTRAYRTVARRSYVKRKLPADLFRTDTAPRLVLITCGGSFDDGTYSHNVVVYAKPVP